MFYFVCRWAFWFIGFSYNNCILKWLTCVCVNPKLAANSARSGSAKYCVLWNLLFSCCSWRELYIVLGFLIFFPLPFTLRPVSSILSANESKHKSKYFFINSDHFFFKCRLGVSGKHVQHENINNKILFFSFLFAVHMATEI